MNLRPPGAKESLLQEMCEPLRKYKNEHIKVIWAGSWGHTVNTVESPSPVLLLQRGTEGELQGVALEASWRGTVTGVIDPDSVWSPACSLGMLVA